MVSKGLPAGGLMVLEEDLRRELMEALEGLHKSSVVVLGSRCKGFKSTLCEDSIVVLTKLILTVGVAKIFSHTNIPQAARAKSSSFSSWSFKYGLIYILIRLI